MQIDTELELIENTGCRVIHWKPASDCADTLLWIDVLFRNLQGTARDLCRQARIAPRCATKWTCPLHRVSFRRHHGRWTQLAGMEDVGSAWDKFVQAAADLHAAAQSRHVRDADDLEAR